MTSHRFPMRLGRRSGPLLRLFGVRGEENAYVDVDGDSLTARFGRAHLEVPLANIAGWRIEGPWAWITAIGVRMSIRHADLSFAGSPRGGVRLDFKEGVPYGPLRPLPALYVGVEDLEGLAALLSERGIPGVDARTDKSPVVPVSGALARRFDRKEWCRLVETSRRGPRSESRAADLAGDLVAPDRDRHRVALPGIGSRDRLAL